MNKLETIAAEMRLAAGAKRLGDRTYVEYRDVLSWADRIEEAVKLKGNANAVAMREALEYVRDRVTVGWNYPEARGRIVAALAAPPRNCDVGTAKEQAERFKAFCLPRVGKCSENSTCPAKHPCNEIGIQYCQLKWAQMPYEAEKGGAE